MAQLQTVKKVTQLIMSVMLVSAISACSKEESSVVVNDIRPVKTADVTLASAKGIKSFPASIEPALDAQLTFRVNGQLAKLLVKAGDHVEKNQVLAILETQDFDLAIEQAQAKFNLSNSQFTRAKQLFSDQLIAISAYDEAKAQLDIAKAQLELAKTNLTYTELHAPFTGVIAQTHIESFETVQAKQPILEIQGRELLDVAIQVPETLMALLPKEADHYQPTLILDALPNSEFKVSFKEHDISPNAATKSYKAVFSLKAPESINVLSGMSGTLYADLDKIFPSNQSQFKLPLAAVFLPNQFAGQDKHFVYRISPQMTAELVEVKLSKVINNMAVVTPVSGTNLVKGDKVISAGSHLIKPNQQVSLWQKERGL